MSRQVDERIVSMQFDNKHFEKNVSTTMSTLDKLKAKLDFKGASKGLEDVGTAANKIDMSSLGRAVETVRVKFSALDVMAVTALTNITNQAMRTGQNMIKALTIDPIKTGLSEYETQINAIQTILANTESKGTTLDDVNGALDELNKYADQTIYNFTEMTRNIGTFTAAGVGLNESVSAIKGIANLAAVSGSSSQQASTAMYQLSQALAAGRVSLMDWNSVVNAGMGGQVFQDALKRTAKAMGTDVDAIIGKYGSFRESLTQGEWLTTDVLTKTLEQFTMSAKEGSDEWKEFKKTLMDDGYTEAQAEEILKLANTATDAATKVKTFSQLWDTLKETAQSGWTQTWELIFGDFEEAKELFSGLYQKLSAIIEAGSNVRNAILGKALGGSKWDDFTKKIEGAGISIGDFQQKLIETSRENGINIDELIDKYGSLKKVISNGEISTDIFVKTLEKFADSGKTTNKVTDDMTDKLNHFQKLVDEVWNGDWYNGEERVKALTEAGYEYNKVQDLVNKVEGGRKLTLEDLNEETAKAIGLSDEQVKKLSELTTEAKKTGTPLNDLIESLQKPTGRELLVETVHNLLDAILKPLQAVRDAFGEIFTVDDRANAIYNIIDAIHSFSECLVMSDDAVEKFKRTLKGVFALIDIIGTLTGSVFSIIKTVVESVLKALGVIDIDILSFTASIGDSIVVLRDWIDQHNVLAKVIEFVVPYIVKAAKAVGRFFSELWNAKKVQGALSNLIDVFNNLFGSVDWGNLLSGTPQDIINGFVNGLKTAIPKAAEAIWNFATTLVTTFCEKLGIHSPSVVFASLGAFLVLGLLFGMKNTINTSLGAVNDIITTILQNVSNILQNGLNTLLDLITNIGLKIKDVFGTLEIDFSKVLVIGRAIGVFLIIKKLTDVISGFGKTLANVTQPFAKLGKVFDAVTGAVNDLKDAKIKQMKVNNFKTIAISIGILAASIALLSKMDQGAMWSAVGALTVMGAGLVIIMKVLDKMQKDIEITKVSLFALGLAAALFLMSFAISKIAEIGWQDSLISIGLMALVIIEMAAVMRAFGKFVKGEAAVNIDKAGVMMIKMAIAMGIMALVIKMINSVVGDMTLGELGLCALVLIGFGAICAGLVAVSKISGQHADKAGKMASKIAGAILLMVITMKIVNTMSSTEIQQGIEVITEFGKMCAVLVAISVLSGQHADKAGKMMSRIGGAMLMLSLAMKVLGTLTPEQIETGFDVIKKVGTLFLAFVALSKLTGEHASKAGSMLFKMSLAIGILALTMKLIATISEDDINRGLGVILKMELLFAVIIAASYLAGENASKAGTMLLKMSAAILIIVAAIALLSLLHPDDVIRGTACISALIGMFALLIASTHLVKDAKANLIIMAVVIGELIASIVILSLLDQSKVITATACIASLIGMFALLVASTSLAKTATGTLIVLTVVVAALGGILYLLSGLPVKSTLSIAASLSMLLLSMSIVMVLLSAIGPAASSAIAAAVAMDAVIVIVAGLMVAIGALMTYVPELEQFLDKGIDVLVKIATGLGEALGGFVKGVLTEIASGLPSLAIDLSNFMILLTPFIMGAKQIDESMVNGIKGLAEMILILTAADILEGLTSWLTGGSSLTSFAEELIPFGEAMVKFSNTVSGKIDAGAVEAASNAGKTMAEMAATLPNEGGVVGWFMGENDMKKFGEQLVPFGEAMVEFSNAVAGKIDAGAVESAANAGKIMAEMASTLPNSGGVVGWFMGDNDLDDFGSKVKSFGEAMVGFSEKVAGNIDADAVTAAANAGSIMVELQKSLPEKGGWFDNTMDISDLGDDLVDLGEAIKDFDDEMVSVNTMKVSDAMDSISKLVSTIKNMNGLDTSGVKSFHDAISTLSTTNISGFLNNFGGEKDNAGAISAGASIITSITKGMVSRQSSLNDIMVQIMTNLVEKVNEKKVVFTAKGIELISQLINGILRHKDRLATVMSSTLNNAITVTRRYYAGFCSVGLYLASGFANGIASGSYQAAVRAKAMASAAKRAAEKELDENSPSKEFYKIGAFAGEGFVNALGDYASESYKASTEMASSARKGLSGAIAKVADAINSDIDTQPTIRPVVDLSAVTAGASAINGLFSDQSLSVTGNVRAISSMMSQRNQNGTTDDVISAIDNLRKDLGNVGGTSYNINGVTYNGGSDVAEAIETIVRAIKIERRG